MPIFISQGRYSREAIKGLVAKPEDRGELVTKVIEAAGGKLLAYYVTFGEYDWLTVSEFPDHQGISTVMLAAAAGGGITDMKTTLAMTGAEAKAIFAATGKVTSVYRAPGAG
jgi:uncharacterized protein with GYD domain